MTPYYGLNHRKKPYFYYDCTRHGRMGRDGCSMKPVPAEALEGAIASRLTQLSNDQDLVTAIVKNCTSESSELLRTLRQTRSNLARQRIEVQRKIDALVESIADRKVGVKSISRRIIELEDQKEQLDNEVLDIEMQVEERKKKVVSAGALKNTLTTFSELYEEATPEERTS